MILAAAAPLAAPAAPRTYPQRMADRHYAGKSGLPGKRVLRVYASGAGVVGETDGGPGAECGPAAGEGGSEAVGCRGGRGRPRLDRHRPGTLCHRRQGLVEPDRRRGWTAVREGHLPRGGNERRAVGGYHRGDLPL